LSKERTVPTHPVYCSCCPGKPVVMAEKLGDHLLEIQSRKHGRTHVAVVLLDKYKHGGVASKSDN
jgi:hypothetical protein